MGGRAVRIAIRIVLVLSLAGNLATAAVIWRLNEMRETLGMAEARLPREVRREFRARARDDAALLAAARTLGEARGAVISAGAAQPFDEAALDAAMVRVREATAAMVIEAQRVLRPVLREAAGR